MGAKKRRSKKSSDAARRKALRRMAERNDRMVVRARKRDVLAALSTVRKMVQNNWLVDAEARADVLDDQIEALRTLNQRFADEYGKSALGRVK